MLHIATRGTAESTQVADEKGKPLSCVSVKSVVVNFNGSRNPEIVLRLAITDKAAWQVNMARSPAKINVVISDSSGVRAEFINVTWPMTITEELWSDLSLVAQRASRLVPDSPTDRPSVIAPRNDA